MSRPLEGIKVVEVAMWAFVPACGGVLADLGASVIKIEPPDGDPIRGLTIGAAPPGEHGFILSWENYNRGKRAMTLDLRQDAGREVLYKLIADADVFLTNLLPRARKRMQIDIDDIKSRNPGIIYAVGSGTGRQGPDGDKGGYDTLSFWHRGSVSSQVTPDEQEYPIGLPCGAFGDVTTGAMLAGGICAAIAQRAMTGHASVVDASLLNSAMWSMQRAITQASLSQVKTFPKPSRRSVPNVLVNNYKTSDDRIVSLCMLQGQRYWPNLCEVMGRPDLAQDPRFATEKDRNENIEACVAEFDAMFAAKPLDEWREILSRQDGQWDVVQLPGELEFDPQVEANGYMQEVDYGDGRSLKMVSTPMQFDGAALPAAPAPAFNANGDEILAELGYSEEEIINLKIANVVF
ncbi:MAG TPA: CoA transferase [Novosphingobium sp.]|nr:CoA transferase [Novosphingobium sp.]